MHINTLIKIVGHNPLAKDIERLNHDKITKLLSYGPNIRHIPKADLTDELIEMAIQSGYPVLKYLQNPSDNHIDMSLKHDRTAFLQLLPEQITPERELMAVCGTFKASNIKLFTDPRDELIIGALHSTGDGVNLPKMQLLYNVKDDVSDDVLEAELKVWCSDESQQKYKKRIQSSPRLRQAMINRSYFQSIIDIDWSIEEQKQIIINHSYDNSNPAITDKSLIPLILSKKKYSFLSNLDISASELIEIFENHVKYRAQVLDNYHGLINHDQSVIEYLFNCDNYKGFRFIKNPTKDQIINYIKVHPRALKNVPISEEYVKLAFDSHGVKAIDYIPFEEIAFDYKFQSNKKIRTYTDTEINAMIEENSITLINCDKESLPNEIEVNKTKRGIHVATTMDDLVILCDGQTIKALISIYELHIAQISGGNLIITGHEEVITLDTDSLKYDTIYTR
jgi:hypothetical protein